MKDLKLLVILLVLGALAVSFAYAAEPGGAVVSGNVSLGDYNATPAGNVSTVSGNVYQANLSAEQSTFRWVGLVGNVTGNIFLGDDNDDVLYQWVASGNLVYASNVSSVTWASLAEANTSEVLASADWLTSGSDNYTETFTGANESIGSNIFDDLGSEFADTQGDTWKTYSLTDGSNLVFAGKVNEDGTSYTGSVADYQMIVPEDGTGNDATATVYYLWVELQ